MLLAALPSGAAAANPEMRGEWQLVLQSPGGNATGTAFISVEANPKGEFATSNVVFLGIVHGTFSGTLNGSETSVTVTTEAAGPAPEGKFTSTAMKIETNGGGQPVITGSGTLTAGGTPMPATVTATRVKTYAEVQEREAKEKLEREEQEARENVRGEWSLTLESLQNSKGTALITKSANANNEFASSSALFEGVVPSSFSGTLPVGKGSNATVKVTTQAYGPAPAGEFTSSTMTVESSGASLSMHGTGTLTLPGTSLPATLTATRIKTYAQVLQQQEKEALEKEALEREAREAKEKLEREAREKTEGEAREKAEREAREKAEREAAQSHIGSTPPIVSGGSTTTPSPPVSVQLAAKAFTAGSALSLRLTNPNAFAVQGHVTLSLASGKAAASKKKPTSLGTASFSISPHGTALVKIALSRSGRAELARRHTLHAIASIATTASGQPSASTSYKITLHAPAAHHHG
jgi:hypothetical protein